MTAAIHTPGRQCVACEGFCLRLPSIDDAMTAMAVAQGHAAVVAAAEALVKAAMANLMRVRGPAPDAGKGRSMSCTPYALTVERLRKGHQLFIGAELHTIAVIRGRNAARVELRLKRGGPNAQTPADVRLSFPTGTPLEAVAGVCIDGVWQG